MARDNALAGKLLGAAHISGRALDVGLEIGILCHKTLQLQLHLRHLQLQMQKKASSDAFARKMLGQQAAHCLQMALAQCPQDCNVAVQPPVPARTNLTLNRDQVRATDQLSLSRTCCGVAPSLIFPAPLGRVE